MLEITQDYFDLEIGRLDHCISTLVLYSKSTSINDINAKTTKHHAEDMILAGVKILKNLNVESKYIKQVIEGLNSNLQNNN